MNVQETLTMLHELNPHATVFPHPNGNPQHYLYVDGGFLQGERDLLRDVFKIKLFCIMDDSAIISLVDECFNPVLEN